MRTRLVFLMLAGALVLAACSDADEATTEESPTASGTATATASAAPGTEATDASGGRRRRRLPTCPTVSRRRWATP